MRVKIGTSIERELLKKAQNVASSRGTRLNDLIEEALQQYLEALERKTGADLVTRTWGTSSMDSRTLKKLMQEDVYES